MSSFDGLVSLVDSLLGQPAAGWLRKHVEVPEGLLRFSWHEEALHRAWLAEALNLCLLHKLVEAVPDGRRTWYRLADSHLTPALDELLRVVLYVEPGCCAGESCTCA